MKEKIKIASLSDSPKLTTGFGNVNKQILQGFHEAGMEVISFGFMDSDPDIERELPYTFWPTNPMDPLGHNVVGTFLSKVKPDILFTLCDPGNLDVYIQTILHLRNLTATGRGPGLNKFPVISYVPIEGFPIPSSFGETFDRIQTIGGKVVCYSKGMADLVHHSFENIEPEWAHHGWDHADFRRYDPEYRDHLRHISGLSDYFVVGSFGVNKRTKGFDTLIYTARVLKDLQLSDGIKFYFHTSPSNPTMMGYLLGDLARKYGVEDMILFKPESKIEREPGGNIKGVPRETDDFSGIEKPETVAERKGLFMEFGFIDRLNVLDLYVDASQVEGWGLPPFEAMACGVPTISVNDRAIREEIFTGGAYMIDPIPERIWQTWHTGAKLVTIDPLQLAIAIVKLKDNDDMRKEYADLGYKLARQYDWGTTREKFVKLVYKVLENDMSDLREADRES